MAELFDETESGYTATAKTLLPSNDDVIDFSVWGNPEREKINDILVAVNLYEYRRRGCI